MRNKSGNGGSSNIFIYAIVILGNSVASPHPHLIEIVSLNLPLVIVFATAALNFPTKTPN